MRDVAIEGRRPSVRSRTERWAIAVLLLVAGGCASAKRNEFRQIDLCFATARTFRIVENERVRPHPESSPIGKVLMECLPELRGTRDGEADLEIRWTDDLGTMVCLDYWEPRCDIQAAIVKVSDGFFEVNWSRSRPAWCVEPDCVEKLFLRDLKRAACRKPLPEPAWCTELR